MPLSSAGLCDAEMTTPSAPPQSRVSVATPGVVITPARPTSMPTDWNPAASALSMSGPEARVSRPMMTRPRPGPLRADGGLQVAEGLRDRRLEAFGILAERDARGAGDLDDLVGREEAVAGAVADAVGAENFAHEGEHRIENRD